MKLKLLLLTTLLFSLLAKAQSLKDEKLMGEWKVVHVDDANWDDVPKKEALKILKEAFLNSIFAFDEDGFLQIDFPRLFDERLMELHLFKFNSIPFMMMKFY